MRISTSSVSAILRAVPVGRTLKPTIIASEAAASMISESLIAPTAPWITLTCIFSVDSLMSESLSASTEPSTSALTITLSSLKSPIAMRRPISSKPICFLVRIDCSRWSCSRLLAISRASCSVGNTLNSSPACGAPFKPRIEHGSPGLTSLMRCPRSLNIALIRPWKVPARTISPMRSVPSCTSSVATYPRPLSSEDSMTEPLARRFGLALSSSSSASSSTFSNNSNTPSPFLAEISWHW